MGDPERRERARTTPLDLEVVGHVLQRRRRRVYRLLAVRLLPHRHTPGALCVEGLQVPVDREPYRSQVIAPPFVVQLALQLLNALDLHPSGSTKWK